MTNGVEVHSFRLAAADPFLAALINLMSEPRGSETAHHAFVTTCEWWEEHSAGPTREELLAAMFEPHDWLTVVDDPTRPRPEREAQVTLLREWIVHYWTRLGAITFVPGHDDVVRPGSTFAFVGEEHAAHDENPANIGVSKS